MSAEPLYDVIIWELASGRIDAVIGTNMRSYGGEGTGRNTAELRVQTGLERINDRFDCTMVPAGKFKKGDTFKQESLFAK